MPWGLRSVGGLSRRRAADARARRNSFHSGPSPPPSQRTFARTHAGASPGCARSPLGRPRPGCPLAGRNQLRLIRFPPLLRRNEVVIRKPFPESRWALRFFRWACRCRASVRRYGQSDPSEYPSGSRHGTRWVSTVRSGSGGNRSNRSFLPESGHTVSQIAPAMQTCSLPARRSLDLLARRNRGGNRIGRMFHHPRQRKRSGPGRIFKGQVWNRSPIGRIPFVFRGE